MNDGQTIREMGHAAAQAQISPLTRRHLDWVYCLCLRSVRDPALAEDVTQCVFMALLKKSGRMPQEANISGWLFKTARHCCNRALRNANTRRRHERAAARMRPDAVAVEVPMRDEELIPLLDEQIAGLSKADRTALLLRYYERRSLRQVGDVLGISEEAAKKRVQRAVEKLRTRMNRRQIPLGEEALTAILAEKLVRPAPAKLTAAILAHATHGTTATVMTASQSKISTHVSLKALASGKTALAATGAVLATALVAAGITVALAKHSHPKAPQKLIISRATTYITRPLDKYGLPNYVAALNREFARGVSGKDNAAIPLLRLFLATEHPNAQQHQWALNALKLMHVAPASKPREPFTFVDRYVFQHIPANKYTITALKNMLRGSPEWRWMNWSDKGTITSQSLRWAVAQEETDAAREHPWTAKQCPLVFKYLQSQRKDLRIIVTASKMPQIYFPLVSSRGFSSFSPVASIAMPLPIFFRQCEEMCSIKANFCLGKKDLKGCEKYLLATRRLIALSAVPPWGLARLGAANSITQYLVPGQRALLSYPGLTASDALHYLHIMNASPITLPLLTLHRHIYRYLRLDYLITFYRRTAHIGPRPHYNLGSPPVVANPLPPLLMHPPRGIRWNWQLRQINSLTSLYLLANQWKTPPFNLSRHSPRFAFIARLKHLENQKINPVMDPNRAFRDVFVSSLFPGPGRDAFRTLQMIALGREEDRLWQIGFALAAYHAANGKYPATLLVLCPKYLRGVPKNLLTFKPPEYRPGANGYVLIANEPGHNSPSSKHDLQLLRNQNLLLQMPNKISAQPVKNQLP